MQNQAVRRGGREPDGTRPFLPERRMRRKDSVACLACLHEPVTR
ncbi:hypothetical protein E0H45_18530 [Kribbella soli]|uniref:Uncharacterized protein n=1 Tax=Kribbella soli TaxID=1124743 RepID=A0A4R0HEA4_9ACTN|nr:hypothetical protein E0H45_18530 [Kribbella soli]